MMQSAVSEVRRVRRWRSNSEKRQIVQLTFEPGASVAEIARAYGLNANQLFKWRRAWDRGELQDGSAALLPVTVSSPIETPEVHVQAQVADGGSIHIELPGDVRISVEHGADLELVRCVLASVKK